MIRFKRATNLGRIQG